MFESFDSIMPNGLKERLFFVGVAITACFCEEVIFDGFMFYTLEQLGWGLSTLAIAIVSSILFVLGHGYQGWEGMILTGLLGCHGKTVYGIGTLWIPIIAYIIIDLRFAFLPNLRKLIKSFEQRKRASA